MFALCASVFQAPSYAALGSPLVVRRLWKKEMVDLRERDACMTDMSRWQNI